MDTADLITRLVPLTRKEIHIGMQGDEELALVAGVHEYGSAKMNIPARSFIGAGKKKAQAAIGKLVRAGVTEIALDRKNTQSLQTEIGELGLERMKKNFDRIKQPALSPIYARRKASNKLLIADEDLRDALTYTIVLKGGR